MYLGLDFGTSGARACVVDDHGEIVHEDRIQYVDASGQKAGFCDGRQVVQNAVGHIFMKMSFVAKRPHIELEAF